MSFIDGGRSRGFDVHVTYVHCCIEQLLLALDLILGHDGTWQNILAQPLLYHRVKTWSHMLYEYQYEDPICLW